MFSSILETRNPHCPHMSLLCALGRQRMKHRSPPPRSRWSPAPLMASPDSAFPKAITDVSTEFRVGSRAGQLGADPWATSGSGFPLPTAGCFGFVNLQHGDRELELRHDVLELLNLASGCRGAAWPEGQLQSGHGELS